MPNQLGSLIERLRANAEDYTGELQCEATDALEACARLLAERTREQRMLDLACYGSHITRDGERIAPGDFYAALPPAPTKG